MVYRFDEALEGGVNRRVKLRADTISTAKRTEFDDIKSIEKILLNEIE